MSVCRSSHQHLTEWRVGDTQEGFGSRLHKMTTTKTVQKDTHTHAHTKHANRIK